MVTKAFTIPLNGTTEGCNEASSFRKVHLAPHWQEHHGVHTARRGRVSLSTIAYS